MMTKIDLLCARAGASAIAAALALSPTYAASPKPIVDMSDSPAVSGKPQAAPPAKATNTKRMIGPFDERTAEIGGGAMALLILGAGAFALSRRKTSEEEWYEDDTAPEAHDPLFDEPMFNDQRDRTEASVFAWGDRAAGQPARRSRETWIERAYRGPTPDNPSASLRRRLKRAAFFDKRGREAAAGKAAPVDTDAGLPDAIAEERELEAA